MDHSRYQYRGTYVTHTHITYFQLWIQADAIIGERAYRKAYVVKDTTSYVLLFKSDFFLADATDKNAMRSARAGACDLLPD